jgi:peptidyl-prolyl cis-trans isomerase B (cyclophilin B)
MVTSKHKAATAVTLAPLAEKTAFEQLVQAYWKHATFVAVAIVAVVVYWYVQREQHATVRRASWDTLLQGAGFDGLGNRSPTAKPETMTPLIGQLKGSDADPWAHLIQAQVCLTNRDYAAARSTLEELKRDSAKNALTQDLWLEPSSAALGSAVSRMLAAISEQEKWEREHPELLANPPPDPDAPRVRLKTSLGDITVALYANRAPQHVSNFLAKVSEGYYNGTRFHRIVANRVIEGGDPNSKTDDKSTWGRGGTGADLPLESTGLFHFAGVLTAAPGATAGATSGITFALTCEANHEWDSQRVVFGAVTEGLDIVRQISNAPLAPGSQELPADAVLLVTTEKL